MEAERFFNEHPISRGIISLLTIGFQNGPDIIVKGKEVEVIASNKNNSAVIVTSRYGKGIVVLFSAHTVESKRLIQESCQFCLPNPY